MKRRTFLEATLATVVLTVSLAFGALRTAVAEICSKVNPNRRAIKLPPLPKWNKTTDDIDSADFVRQVHDYERSLLRPNIVFPRVGQIWETVRDCDVDFRAWCDIQGGYAWLTSPVKGAKTFYGFGKVRLPRGERVRIDALDDVNKPLQVTFVPLRYDELHWTIVPENEVRESSHYVLALRTAYTVCCSRDETGFFQDLFRLAEDLEGVGYHDGSVT